MKRTVPLAYVIDLTTLLVRLLQRDGFGSITQSNVSHLRTSSKTVKMH